MRTMRNGATAAVLVAILGLAVTLMHTGLAPMGGMQHSAPASPAPGHAAHAGSVPGHAGHGASATTEISTAGHAFDQKQSADAVHDHEAHLCAGTVVQPQALGAPSLVAVLPAGDRAHAPSPHDVETAARGPPPWTVLDLAELCLLRI